MINHMTVNSRHITADEISSLPIGFTEAFNIKAVKFIDATHNPFAKHKIVCRGPRIYWQNHPSDFVRETMLIRSLLVHELCHVWQYETGRLNAFRYLIDPRNWSYSYRVRTDANFDDYPTEKQADLLQDWFLVNSGGRPIRFEANTSKPTHDWLNKVVPFDWTPR